jgi:hypothetical protein
MTSKSIQALLTRSFLRKFFIDYPIIISGERHYEMIDGVTVRQAAPHICDMRDMEKRSTIHNGDFADALAVGKDKPVESFTAERFDFLIYCAERAGGKPWRDFQLTFEPKEYKPRYSDQDIAHGIDAFRKACGKMSPVKVYILPPGKSATNIMRRTALIYDLAALSDILRDPEKRAIIEAAGVPLKIKNFVHHMATQWVAKEANPRLHDIITNDLYRWEGHGKTVDALYTVLEIN